MSVMRASQRGVSLSGVIVWGFVIAIVAVVGMKVTPDVIEYFKIKKVMTAIAQDGKLASPTDVQNAFDRYANIDQISGINGKDLDVSKEGNAFVVSVAYERRIKMFGPVSVVLDFEISTAK
jgi:hypothetical protein